MDWNLYPTPQAVAEAAAAMLADAVKQKPNALLCLAAGHSSLGVFDRMAAMQETGEADFSAIRFVAMDEWLGMGREHDGSCAGFLYGNLLSRLPVKDENIMIFNGLCGDAAQECARTEQFIDDCGGIDFLLLGIGMNGHLALNEPGADFGLGAHVAELSETTKIVGQKYFKNETPLDKGLTLGIRSLTEARRIVLVADGERKRDIIEKLYHSPATPALPASALKEVPGAVVMLDNAAAAHIRSLIEAQG